MNLSRPLKKARSANSTATSFAAKVATVTEPSADGVHTLAPNGNGQVPCSLFVIPYALGDDNDVFDMRVWGWRRLFGTGGPLWVPTLLGAVTCTIGTSVGVAGTMLLNTERFADTIAIMATLGEPTITADTTRQGTIRLYSPANNTPGWFEIPLLGVEKVEFDFDSTTGDPSEMNALIAGI